MQNLEVLSSLFCAFGKEVLWVIHLPRPPCLRSGYYMKFFVSADQVNQGLTGFQVPGVSNVCHTFRVVVFVSFLSLFEVGSTYGPSKIAKPTVFQVILRGIGKSFQSAITAPRMNLTGYGNATAQS